MPASAALLIDTDILIDGLRGGSRALAYLCGGHGTSRVCCLTPELYAGVRDDIERDALLRPENLLEPISFERDIAMQAGLLLLDYGESRGTGLRPRFRPVGASLQL